MKIAALSLLVMAGCALRAKSLPSSNNRFIESSVCQIGTSCSATPIAITKGDLVFATDFGVVRISAQTGKPVWLFDSKKYSPFETLVTLDSRVYFLSAGPCAVLFSLDVKTGKIAWLKDFNTTCQLWTGGRDLYLGLEESDGIIAVNPLTGKRLWETPGWSEDYVSCLVSRYGRLYTNDRVLDAKTGKLLFWWPIRKDIPPIPKLAHGFDLFHWRERFSFSKFVVSDSLVVGYDTQGKLVAFDAKGTRPLEKWKSPLLIGKRLVNLAVLGKLIYVLAYTKGKASSYNGILQSFSIKNGRPRWAYLFHGSNPVFLGLGIGGRSVYLVKTSTHKSNSDLIAFNGRTGKLDWVFRYRGWLEGSLVRERSHIYIETNSSRLLAVSALNGKEIWKYAPVTDY